MTETSLIIVAVMVFVLALMARPLGRSLITGPMIFLVFGLALDAAGGIRIAEAEQILYLLAEVTLALVLFSDAATIDFDRARRNHIWPERMLVFGIPLAIGLGVAAGLVLLPGWPVWEVAVLAAVLAPTDAALGKAVVSNPAVPERIRQTLTIESGLNDGLVLPAVLFFASVAVGGTDAGGGPDNWLVFAAEQIVFGAAVGAIVGGAGGLAMRLSSDRGLTENAFEGIGVLALAAAAYLSAELVGGNSFLAAFVGGFAFGAVMRTRCAFVFEFMETEGQLLIFGTFLLLGATLLPEAIAALRLDWLLLIGLSLFVVRPAAIWLSLLGTDARPQARLFLGWFGPRGLATALFGLIVLREYDLLTRGQDLLHVAVIATFLSAILHGVSAAPAARWIGRWQARAEGGEKGRDTAGPATPGDSSQ